MNNYSLVTAPAALPILLADAKRHMRVDTTADDGYIQSLIFAATAQAQNITRRALVTQTWKYFLQDWPDEGYIELPFGQLQSVTSVKYKDSEGTENTFSTDYYDADTDADPGRVVLEYGESWPSDTLYPSNPIYIQFVCGYGDHTIKTITGATNASPIVIASATHGCATNDRGWVASVGGNTAANGQWIITKVNDNSFSLNGSVGNAAYTSGGQFVKFDIPDEILHAIRIMVADAYRHREQTITGTIVNRLPHVMNLLRNYQIRMF